MENPPPQNILIIINDGPYGTERAYNALRLGMNLVKQPEAVLRVFLVGDGVVCAKRGQTTPRVTTTRADAQIHHPAGPGRGLKDLL
jgi:sulfur relay (sulfurtransferase) complex TusBCD TusD component (DsrE family)